MPSSRTTVRSVRSEEEEDKDDPKLASVRRSLRDAETDEPELPDTSVDPYKYTWYQAVDTVPQLYISHVFSPGREPATTSQLEELPIRCPISPTTNRWPHSTRRSTTCSWERFGAGTYKGDSIKSGETASIWYIGPFPRRIHLRHEYRRGEEAHLRRGAERRQRLPVRSSRRGRHGRRWRRSMRGITAFRSCATDSGRRSSPRRVSATALRARAADRRPRADRRRAATSITTNYYNYYNYYNNYYGGLYGNSYYGQLL